MKVCSFFGHKDVVTNLREVIWGTAVELIETKGVTTFYVGCNGSFDRQVCDVFEQMRVIYPNVEFYTVLAYLPESGHADTPLATIFPDSLENVPPRYAISRRNKWMVDESDFVVVYARYHGNTMRLKEYAERKKIIVINIST